MKFEIGKRYRWLNFHDDECKWEDGVLIDVFHIRDISYGKLLTRNNIVWAIQLDVGFLEEYKEE